MALIAGCNSLQMTAMSSFELPAKCIHFAFTPHESMTRGQFRAQIGLHTVYLSLHLSLYLSISLSVYLYIYTNISHTMSNNELRVSRRTLLRRGHSKISTVLIKGDNFYYSMVGECLRVLFTNCEESQTNEWAQRATSQSPYKRV